MKGITTIAAMILSAIIFSACTSVNQDIKRVPLDAKIVPAKFKPTVEVIKDPAVAKGTSESEKVLWLLTTKYPNKFAPVAALEDPLRAAAIYDACQKSGADIILAPRFTEERYTSFLWFFKTRKVSVEGIPAKIVGAEELPVEKWRELFGTSECCLK